MNIEPFLFAVTSFISVLLYYPIADKSKFKQRSVTDFETTYWNAFQVFMWSLAVILLRNGPVPSFWASMAIIPTALIYGVISEQPGMDFDLTGNKTFSPLQIGVLSSVGILMFLYMIVLFYKQDYQNPSSIVWKFIPLLIFIAWVLTWLGINKSSTTTSTTQQHYQSRVNAFGQHIPAGTETTTTTTSYNLHIHHWIIGIIGFLLANDSSLYSQLISGVFWGVFCQEAAAYGIALPSDARQSGTGNFKPDVPTLGPGGAHQDLETWQSHYR
jgi:hypothetical protein